MIKIISIMSLFVFVIGLIQFYQISSTTNPENILKISDTPNERVTGTFWNANFYATILEFVIILAFYKMFLVKEKESSFAFYFTVIILNIFMLYLTGSRTAWLTLFLVIPIMFLFQRKFYIGISLMILSILGLYFTISLDIFPRVSSINKDFLFRMGIWKDSISTFKDNFLFGVGPLAYLKISQAKGGPLVAHSHSLYIDSLLSYGIVGCTTLFFAGIFYLKHLFSYYRKKTYSFAVGVVLAVLIHGFLDITILSNQVGFLFLLIISSIHVDDHENA